MNLLIATTSTGKLRDFHELLAGVPLDLHTLTPYTELPAPEETGETFLENARLKALYYATATGQLTLAEDSGLEIAELGGLPGTQSARFNGHTYPEKFGRLYQLLKERDVREARACFVSALVVATDGDVAFETTQFVDGLVAPAPRGERGFGYDPIFFYPPLGRTFAELENSERLAVNHRGQSVRAFREFLETSDGRRLVRAYR